MFFFIHLTDLLVLHFFFLGMTIKENVRRNPGLPAKDLLNEDGPAGWVVAAACLWISFITGITLRPLGFYFVNFVARYESGREPVAWTVSLTSASVIFSGKVSVNYTIERNVFGSAK